MPRSACHIRRRPRSNRRGALAARRTERLSRSEYAQLRNHPAARVPAVCPNGTARAAARVCGADSAPAACSSGCRALARRRCAHAHITGAFVTAARCWPWGARAGLISILLSLHGYLWPAAGRCLQTALPQPFARRPCSALPALPSTSSHASPCCQPPHPPSGHSSCQRMCLSTSTAPHIATDAPHADDSDLQAWVVAFQDLPAPNKVWPPVAVAPPPNPTHPPTHPSHPQLSSILCR